MIEIAATERKLEIGRTYTNEDLNNAVLSYYKEDHYEYVFHVLGESSEEEYRKHYSDVDTSGNWEGYNFYKVSLD